MALVISKATKVPFDTVATFSDNKKNNNNNQGVTINIKLNPLNTNHALKSEVKAPTTKVDKATITDPSLEDEEDFENCNQSGKKTKIGRLVSVLLGIKNAFQWTTNSIGTGLKNSESFMSDNGERKFQSCIWARIFKEKGPKSRRRVENILATLRRTEK